MNNVLLGQLLKDEEGYDPKAHLVDSKWHIGIGHNLEIDQTEDELAAMGLSAPLKDWSGFEISEAQAYALFDIDVQDAIDDVQPAFTPSELNALGETRRAVILSMVFQLGGGGFRKFKNFIKAVKAGDWDTAAEEMLDSVAARQTPARWHRASEAIKLGYFEKYKDIKSDTPASDLSAYSDDEIVNEYNRRFSGNGEDPPEPEKLADGVISANDLANALMQEFIVKHKSREEVMVPDTGEVVKVQPFRLTDAEYKLPTRADLEKAIAETKVDELEYEATDWDCEDFARRFVSKMHEQGIKSAGRVMAWSGNHAFNIVAVQGNPVDFVYVEPQTDKIVELGDGNYDVSNALVVIS